MVGDGEWKMRDRGRDRKRKEGRGREEWKREESRQIRGMVERRDRT